MYEALKRIWKKTGNVETIRKAVAKGWINEAQFEEITGEPYESN